jgi:ABC-2 type transport system permease protein
MLLLATTIFGLQFFSLGDGAGPLSLLVLFVFGITLGIIGSAMVLRLGPASEWLLWPLPAVLAPFAAVFYPLSQPCRPGCRLSPAACRRATSSRACARSSRARRFPLDRVVGRFGGLAIAELLLAGYLYARVYRHAVRTGLLARYSAESAA